jgi:hypothetical protein
MTTPAQASFGCLTSRLIMDRRLESVVWLTVCSSRAIAWAGDRRTNYIVITLSPACISDPRIGITYGLDRAYASRLSAPVYPSRGHG